MKKQSENFKNGEKANINSKKVAATVADDSIREAINSKQIEFKTSPSVGMLTAGMVETRKYENRKITFGVQTLSENVKNIQVQIVDSILEQIPYVINNERGQLAEGITERIKNQNETCEYLTCPTKRGPLMMASLTGILLRARQGRYLVIADVEKAFLQASLKWEDRFY
uniref:Reverse transcriptase domain-containing protein n=2 Tax=Loa loa TaxID=7209 RepID=A0A1I7VBR0_LOALO